MKELLIPTKLTVFLRFKLVADIIELVCIAQIPGEEDVTTLSLLLEDDSLHKSTSENLASFVDWTLFNLSSVQTTTVTSPSVEMLTKIQNSINKILISLSDHEEHIKSLMPRLIDSAKKIDNEILDLTKSSRISAYTAKQYSTRVNTVLQQLIKNWLSSDQIASFFAFEVHGFEYLLDRIGIADSTVTTPNGVDNVEIEHSQPTVGDDNAESLLEGSDLLLACKQALGLSTGGATTSSSAQKNTGSSSNPSDKKSSELESGLVGAKTAKESEEIEEEEFGTTMVLKDLPGQNISASNSAVNWALYKKGNNRCRIFCCQMKEKDYNEVSLLFNLQKTVELR
eukprot:CAMPEP_0114987918 /NCGR_PEP_ID=MMETSP0216-20121206/9292_1 /TAXON_ID=223996 /ORGANISM="Protocruzia adherens, Strain Boccale" /LENGTH=339 /DNA_ID=CAMNT_0002350605 /DNA_START=121 /DNA_END=1136 /DNA_ORIENTATION=+